MKNKKIKIDDILLSRTIIIVATEEELGEEMADVWLEGYLAAYE